jgi:hypothetical protein
MIYLYEKIRITFHINVDIYVYEIKLKYFVSYHLSIYNIYAHLNI